WRSGRIDLWRPVHPSTPGPWRHRLPEDRTQSVRNSMPGKYPWKDWWLHGFRQRDAADRFLYGKTLPVHYFHWWPAPDDAPADPFDARCGLREYCRNCPMARQKTLAGQAHWWRAANPRNNRQPVRQYGPS